MPKSKPGVSAFSISPSDTGANFYARFVYVGTGGDLHCEMENGSEITFVDLAPGFHPISIIRVFEDSSAADLVGLL